MIKFILCLFIVFSSAVYADEMQQKNCEAFAQFGESAMKARQRGVSIVEMYKVIEQEKEPAKKIMETIINETFDYPVFKSLDYADVIAKEYANQFYKVCISQQ